MPFIDFDAQRHDMLPQLSPRRQRLTIQGSPFARPRAPQRRKTLPTTRSRWAGVGAFVACVAMLAAVIESWLR